ncbi:Coenzyme Q-binding protein coq10a, mitochondrial [Coemansia sp. RSA 1200]|nr:Coenzyme Q-binding protein coq10a, mitochondrial [Coemansia sp. RSA 1200]
MFSRAVSVARICGRRQRGFISLPPFGLGSSQGQRYKDAQVFPYTKEQVFDVVADVERYSEFVPMCMGSRVVDGTRRTEKGVVEGITDRETVEAELVVGYPPFRECYMSQVTLERPWRIVATAVPNDSIFKHMKTVWEFVEETQVQTLVRFGIEYEFVSVLHAQAASLVFERMASSNLVAYLARCRKIYG